MRAIIVAAGMGRRLAPYTDDRPKCLVPVAGRPILERQIEAYRAAGVDDIVVVRGYLGHKIDLPGLRFVENPRFRDNNILASLFCAEAEMAGGFLFSYSDIVFKREVAKAAASSTADYGLVIDRRWEEAYVGRDQHPISEGEVARVEGGQVLLVGKRKVPREQAHGEFIGLARFSARAAEVMKREHAKLSAQLTGKPFGDAAVFEKAYLTDLLNHLITVGERMDAIDIDGGWREIDTTQDLDRAAKVVDW